MIFAILALALCVGSRAESVRELSIADGLSSVLDLGNRSLVRSSALGGPAPRSLSDCGSTSGSLPTIPAGTIVSFYYTQLGCSGPYSSMSVDFSASEVR